MPRTELQLDEELHELPWQRNPANPAAVLGGPYSFALPPHMKNTVVELEVSPLQAEQLTLT
jgi:hypothetical protein